MKSPHSSYSMGCSRVLFATCSLCATWGVLAQQMPDAGNLLKHSTPSPTQVTPPASLPQLPESAKIMSNSDSGAHFVLKGVKFSGNTLYSTPFLLSLIADKIGQSISFGELEGLAQRITEHYRRDGYLLAQAIVPQQEIRDGTVEFSVIEGKLGKVRVNRVDNTPITEDRIHKLLQPLRTGEPLQAAPLERVMLLISGLSGIVAQSALEEGSEPGTTDLVIDLNPAPRLSLQVDADNDSSPSIGEYRIGASVRINSPFEWGDNLDFRALLSSGGGLNFARASYEAPIGHSGMRAGASFSLLKYELGGEFTALGASGSADVWGAFMAYPFIRSRQQNLFGRLSFDHKKLTDDISVVDFRSEKRLFNVGAGLIYELRDTKLGGGYTGASATVYSGNLDIADRQARDLDALTGRHTQGSFVKITYQFSRLQNLGGPSRLYLGLSGQTSNKNLDSAEKFSLGGARAVRAYSSAEVLGDDGNLAVVEYRYSASKDLTLNAFYDAGWTRVSHDPLPGESENNRSLRGYGVGLLWIKAGNFTINANLAWRDTARSRVEAGDRNPRVFFQVVKLF